jgi:hypothetical protein
MIKLSFRTFFFLSLTVSTYSLQNTKTDFFSKGCSPFNARLSTCKKKKACLIFVYILIYSKLIKIKEGHLVVFPCKIPLDILTKPFFPCRNRVAYSQECKPKKSRAPFVTMIQTTLSCIQRARVAADRYFHWLSRE